MHAALDRARWRHCPPKPELAERTDRAGNHQHRNGSLVRRAWQWHQEERCIRRITSGPKPIPGVLHSSALHWTSARPQQLRIDDGRPSKSWTTTVSCRVLQQYVTRPGVAHDPQCQKLRRGRAWRARQPCHHPSPSLCHYKRQLGLFPYYVEACRQTETGRQCHSLLGDRRAVQRTLSRVASTRTTGWKLACNSWDHHDPSRSSSVVGARSPVFIWAGTRPSTRERLTICIRRGTVCVAYCLSIQVGRGFSSHDFDGAFPRSLMTSADVVGRDDERGAPVNSGSLVGGTSRESCSTSDATSSLIVRWTFPVKNVRKSSASCTVDVL